MMQNHILPFLFTFATFTMGMSLVGISYAQVTAVDEEGYVTISGEISTISPDRMTIRHNNGTTEVTFEEMDRDILNNLDNADIIERGNMVTVTGKLSEDSFNSSVVEAQTIYITPTP